jgi:Periplasmic binding protein-like domain
MGEAVMFSIHESVDREVRRRHMSSLVGLLCTRFRPVSRLAYRGGQPALGGHRLQRQMCCRADVRATCGRHQVPEDVSVVRYDDVHTAALPFISLTTVGRDAAATATSAVEHVIGWLDSRHRLGRGILGGTSTAYSWLRDHLRLAAASEVGGFDGADHCAH